MNGSGAVLATVGAMGVLGGLGAAGSIAAAPGVALRVDPPAARYAAPGNASVVTSAVRKVMATASIPGAIVGVWRPGQPAYVKAFGVRNRRTRRPMSTGFYMRIGSTTPTPTRCCSGCSCNG
jgi:D-alanyl-D-alanine carboxypeptidase